MYTVRGKKKWDVEKKPERQSRFPGQPVEPDVVLHCSGPFVLRMHVVVGGREGANTSSDWLDNRQTACGAG